MSYWLEQRVGAQEVHRDVDLVSHGLDPSGAGADERFSGLYGVRVMLLQLFSRRL